MTTNKKNVYIYYNTYYAHMYIHALRLKNLFILYARIYIVELLMNLNYVKCKFLLCLKLFWLIFVLNSSFIFQKKKDAMRQYIGLYINVNLHILS